MMSLEFNIGFGMMQLWLPSRNIREKPRRRTSAHSTNLKRPQRAIMIVIYIDTLQHKSYETCFRCHCEDLYQRDATRNQAPERLRVESKIIVSFFSWQLQSKGKQETSCLARHENSSKMINLIGKRAPNNNIFIDDHYPQLFDYPFEITGRM